MKNKDSNLQVRGQLMRVLRNFNITKISDLELISNSTDRLDITFHFFGIKGDSNRIREAITRMVERGRIGNITLVSNYHLFDENPPLNLLDMTINQKSAIREDGEFIISCTAQGSSRMQFLWFKDGAIVNASKATREIWTTVLPPETKDVFTAILGVTKASRMDEGIYTCKVTDWGVEQCRSLHIHVKSPPRLRVDPASVTLERGDSLRVRCLSPGNDDIKRYAQLGYSWTRNSMLFQSDPANVMWEDLYPDGSILKINNIQKSAEYACVVSNTVKPVSKSVYITVIDRNAVQVCHAETLYGVRWPTSAPGAAIISDCPRGFEGHSRRICEKHDIGNSTWLLPDFSMCIRDQLLKIYNEFRALSAGFQQSNSSAILRACFEYTLRRYTHFLPGEAGFLVDMLHEIDSYLQLKGTQLEREMAAEIILHILDKVMQNAKSLNSQQQIKKLQLLTQSAALNRETIAASQLATSTSTSGASASSSISSLSAGSTSASSSSSSSSSSLSASSSSSSTSLIVSSSQASSSFSTATQADIAVTSLSPSLTTTTTLTGSGQHLTATLHNTDNHGGTSGTTNAVGSNSANNSRGGTNTAIGSILTLDEDLLSLDRLTSLRIYMTSVKTLPFNLRIYGDDLFSDQLYMDIGLSSRLLNVMANSTIFASVISYKNLKSFLPKTYYTRGSDPKETDYILASRIIQTWLFQSNRSNDNFREPLDLPFESGHVEIIFQHESVPKDSDWMAVCGHDYKASFESTWRSDLCITKNLMENITRCICPLSGTYVVMLTKRNSNSSQPNMPHSPLFVIISCACCLLQSCSAFIILLPIWFNRKCAITFLKMQFCVSTSSIMVIFLLGFLKMLPVNWQAIISSSLASLLLLGVSTLIAIALVIHSELVPKKLLHSTKGVSAAATSTNATQLTCSTANIVVSNIEQQQQELEKRCEATSGNVITNITQISNSNRSSTTGANANNTTHNRTLNHGAAVETNLPSGIRGAIGISWLLPLLFAITSPLICSIIGKWPQNWWLEIMTTTTHTATTSMGGDSINEQSSSSSSANNYFLTHMPPLVSDNNLIETNTARATATTNPFLSSQNGKTTTSQPFFLAEGVSSSFSSSTTSSSANWYYPQQQHQHRLNSDTTNTDMNADGNAYTTSSLSFIIFICVDLLFILLFLALFAILIKKLLWIWHKNRNVQTRAIEKFNATMARRIGLLYRLGILLFVKLSTDALFIAYVNSSENSLWCYPFGISCILLGFTILLNFVLKAECNLRTSTSSRTTLSSSDTLKKKLSSSKTSLDETYCTAAISNPLNFYTAHEKEKENEGSAPPPPSLTTLLQPQQMDMTSGVQLPLTIISTAPRCQLIPTMAGIHDHSNSVDTFLGASTLERKPSTHVTCLQDLQQQQVKTASTIASTASRCCNILGGNANTAMQTLPAIVASGGPVSFYDAYGSLAVGMTGSLGRRTHIPQQHATHDFIGVETLDILQGVSPDSIIGIRTSNILPATQYHTQHLQTQHHNSYVDSHMLPPAMVSISNLTAPPTTYSSSIGANSCSNNPTVTTITTTSVTTQTPKSQKRVTIMEPTTHTFDPMLPTMVAVSGATTSHLLSTVATTTPTPIITITCSSIDDTNASSCDPLAVTTSATTTEATSDLTTTSCSTTPDDDNSINGMFDRITHDLDYLLNRTNEIPPPPLPPSGSIPTDSVSMAASPVTNRVSDIIIEECEQEL
ncbi:serine-rich adhesin for platelets [Teleopsis dalmanni]|uniref:serine-rich adhesin for platelets n=1 Tax=Teleopsis dalmanni TaxID=139649 RepID=UPI0018CEAF4D|nr:serine-rich adhesin for platelets [Teleopsis dalmanni]